MGEGKGAYRQIMKATSVFGGVQVFQIFIRIIRAKFIAILLGPSGIGIAGLLASTTQLISGLTNFGLGTSAVKEISGAFASGSKEEVARKTAIVRRWVWVTGLLGAIITLVTSPWLSELTFGNKNYTYAFAWISITLLFNQISTGQNVLLRGTRKIRYLAQASLIGSILGLVVTLPLYYFYGIDGIVPGIILTSMTTLVLSWYFSRKVDVEKTSVSVENTISEGKDMLKLGFMFSLSGMITLGASYIVKIFINRQGGVDQVGMYSAGFSIINTYVGMIFTAMSTDYYPRLSGVAEDLKKRNLEINQQAEIALLILAPIIMIFMVFIKWIVILLFSQKFLPVVDLILWAVLGIFFKAGGWTIGFLFLSKGASKLFFWNELAFNVYFLILNVAGYYFLGLKGLGLAFLISYAFHMIQVYFVANKHYQFTFHRDFYKIFGYQGVLGIACLATVLLTEPPYTYLIGMVFIALSGFFAYKELDKRIGVKAILATIKKKFKK